MANLKAVSQSDTKPCIVLNLQNVKIYNQRFFLRSDTKTKCKGTRMGSESILMLNSNVELHSYKCQRNALCSIVF